MPSRIHHATHKAKKSFTLSRSSVAFLERLRKERRAPSISPILDELIRDAESRLLRRREEEAIASYYDALSSEESREQEAWGEFALKQYREEPT